MNLVSLSCSDWRRTGLVVAAVHVAVILSVSLPALFQKPPPPLLHVKLAALQASPTESTTTDTLQTPEPSPSEDAGQNPAQTPAPDPPTQNSWRARSVDDIRNSATLDPVQQRRADPPSTPQARSPDVSGLRETLRNKTRVDVTASANAPQAGAWEANRYAAAVHARLYALWRQPSGTPGQTARARLRVDRNGRILEARVLAADTQAMRQSIVKLLNSLTKLPPPKRYGLSDTSVSLPLVFRLED